MPIPATDFHHVRLTVRDIEISRKFYEQVFGFEVAYELPPGADRETREKLWFLFGGVLYKFAGGLFGLRPAAPRDDSFDENRTGLDHVSFAVASYADLESAASVLDDLGITHEPIKNVDPICILEFRDPDNIALEITSPAP